MKEQNPPETLRASTNLSTTRVEKNFRWPSSMPEYLKRHAFRKIADVEFEFDDEIGFNFIFFYNAFDRSEFTGHENEWVTVHNQRVVEYGEEYSDDQLNYVLETMPGAIQLPVDQERLPRSKPAKTVISQSTNSGDDYKVRIRVRRPNENNLIAIFSYDFYDTMNNNKRWSTNPKRAGGYGAPAEQIYAFEMFEVSIGDDNNWSKWVQAKILLWEYDPDQNLDFEDNYHNDSLSPVPDSQREQKDYNVGSSTKKRHKNNHSPQSVSPPRSPSSPLALLSPFLLIMS
ncbi:10890_t:CDS:2 [Entrophospora sp. SA101]|nr:10890_t:CDS:2 [Entrophospora sp. SA101]